MRIVLISLMIAVAVALIGCSSDSGEPSTQATQDQVEQDLVEQQSRPAPSESEPQSQDQSEAASEPTAITSADPESGAAEPEQSADDEPAPAQQRDQAAAQTEQHTQQAQQAQQAQASQQTKQNQQEQVPKGTRIVSLFGDITEILYALGVEDFIVGVDVSSVYPEAAQDLPDVGFAGALNAEGILALSPTIVIGGGIVAPGPVGVLEQLEQAGVEVLVLPELVGLDSPAIKIRTIGAAIGIPQRAEALAIEVEQAIELAKPKPDPDSEVIELKVLFVYLRRGGIQLVSGAGREAETIITASGGVDAGAAIGIEGWQPLSPEALLAINPDVYLVMQLGYDAVGGIEGMLAIPGMAETEAGKHRRVIVMEDILLLGFGPRMAETIVQLRDYLDEVRASLTDSSGANE